jgi:hypothetical protein
MSVPLVLFVGLIYVGVAISESYASRHGYSLMFIGYALANLGIAFAMKGY